MQLQFTTPTLGDSRLPATLWAKVQPQPNGCWLWTGATRGTLGYGTRSLHGRMVLVHRAAYEVLIGPVPKGLELDHLCRQPRCLNPAHLEPVTRRENSRRGDPTPLTINGAKTHCIRGHRFDEQNTYVRIGRPGRDCRRCWAVRRNSRRIA